MSPFFGRRGNWKMVELLGLDKKLRLVKAGHQSAQALYLYKDLGYPIIYNIMVSYKNYLNWPRTIAHNCFNKLMSKLQIKIEYGFALHQNFWIWNKFYLRLKLCQDTAVYYAISVFLANIWTYIQEIKQAYIFLLCHLH